MIDTLEKIIQDLEDKLSELKAYKSKLESAEVHYRNIRHYLKEKDLEDDYNNWGLDIALLSGKEYLQVKEKQKEIVNQEFSNINPEL